MSEKKDEWQFKVEEEPEVEEKLKTLSPAERVKLKSRKKEEAPLPKPTMLDLAHEKLPERKTMAQIARRTAALERYAEIEPADMSKRILSNVIDLILFAGVFGAIYFFKDDLYREYVKYLETQGISQIYDPKLIKEILVVGGGAIIMFFLHVVPSILFFKSFGKKICNIRIGHVEVDRRARGFQVFLREVIAKPISVMVLLGFVLPFFNSNKRSLHDFIAGTTLYIDD
ncbi:MAG: hypothetical protein Fur0010_18980 [Bdellovibrio sp.]